MFSSLKKRSDFVKIAKEGNKVATKGLILQTLGHDNETSDLRVGITVTKNVSKKAVVRNRIKRRLRALARDIVTSRAKNSSDYVLIGRISTLDRSFEDLKKDLKYALHSTQTHK